MRNTKVMSTIKIRPQRVNKSVKSHNFETKNFNGVVHLKDWLTLQDGKAYIGMIGNISILKDTDLIGFETHKSESNWCARISSECGGKSVNILGCQIRAITAINTDTESKTLDRTDISTHFFNADNL